MKWIETSLLRLACLFLAVTSFTSCEWDTSPEPEHSLYITYTISAGIASFEGPEQLMLDIQAWIKENQEIYDKKVNYSTGEASEFTKTDDDVVKKYEEFVT